jgi:hypothetical protein
MAERSKLQNQLLSKLPSDGASIGNAALRNQLGWELEQYLKIREELIEAGLAEPWRGRGGSLRRSALAIQDGGAQPPDDKDEAEAAKRKKVLEAKLYPGFMTSLRVWAKEQGWTDHVVQELANQGRRDTGGVWTRPDFLVVGYRKFEYTPGTVRDVETFEVKTSSCGISAVFETASHSRVATKSYLAIHRTKDGPSDDMLDRIESECVRFGLGLILFEKPDDYATWDFRVEPNREEPDPFSLEEFIQTQLSDVEKARIRKWW